MTRPDGAVAEAEAVLDEPSVNACKAAARDRLDQDPVDAARAAERLALVFGRRCERLSGRAA